MAERSHGRAWYLVYCKPRQEDVAKTNLERQGYPVYLPVARVARKRLGRKLVVLEPLFPRYLFIELSAETNWAPIRSTLGVSNLVRFGGMPARVPADLVAMLQRRDDTEGVQDFTVPRFREGDRIRIAAGAMEGYEGIFLARTSRERVAVLLEILGTQAKISVNIDQLESGGH